MRIVLIRHGESEANKRNGERIRLDMPIIHNGQINCKLSEKGKEEALKLRDNKLIKELDEIYSSDLIRAFETATICTNSYNFITSSLLRERGLGDFEGKDNETLKKEYPEFFKKYGKESFCDSFEIRVPDGETYSDVSKRCMEFLNGFDFHKNTSIGIFTHCCTIRCMLYCLLNISQKDASNLWIKNCSPIIIEGNEYRKFKLIEPSFDKLLRF